MAGRRKISVAVVGGGLGGTVAAILLEKTGRYEVKVYERAPQIARIGAGINLSSNATRVIAECGVLDSMTAEAMLPRSFNQRDWNTGAFTYVLKTGEFRERYGSPYVIMHRGDLQVKLNAGLKPGVLELGKEMVDIAAEHDRMTLVFADGTRAEADFVIGADGINSKVRELLIGPERAVYTGQIAHRAIYPASRIGDLRLDDVTKWWADKNYFLNYFLTQRHDELYIVTGFSMPWDSDDYTPRPVPVKHMRDGFAGFHPDVLRMIEACPEGTLLAWPVLYREPRPVWSEGRIVLLGDACHPMKPHMGQGAAMAMEDAAMLVRCLEACGEGGFDAEFRLYEAQRFERTTRVKLESDKHEWMRHGSAHDWLFGYDVFAVPLERADNAAARPVPTTARPGA